MKYKDNWGKDSILSLLSDPVPKDHLLPRIYFSKNAMTSGIWTAGCPLFWFVRIHTVLHFDLIGSTQFKVIYIHAKK